jgi:hypothetical protein
MNSKSSKTHKIKKPIKTDNNVIKQKNIHNNDTTVSKKNVNINIQDIILIPDIDISDTEVFTDISNTDISDTDISDTEVFTDSNLNPTQKEIITDTGFMNMKQAQCIVACAGSGKTTTIINKVIYMIKYLNCNPKEFILTTFTRNASQEISKRMRKYLDSNIVNDITIGTFHSIALNQIIENNYQIEETKPDSIPEEYLIKYLDLLNLNNISTYKYLFIDEFQDINQLQYDIIKKWYEKCRLLIVVGDDQQNIYTFRNTSIKYILNFCTEFSSAEYKYLIKNYRCNQGIVSFSNAIISFNTDKIDKQILAGNDQKTIKPKIRFFQNDQKEKEYILEYIKRIYQNSNHSNHSNNYNSPSIAILSRTNKKLYKIENFLALNSIQTQILDAEIKKNILNTDINSNIFLSTIHGSKGLEFDYVIIINCIDGSFPIIGADLQEERRLFYVACTRAKKELLITSLWFDKFKPSRFIYELYNLDSGIADFVSFNWTESTYENLMSNRTNRISEMLSNLSIETYLELKSNNILPPDEYLNFNLINIHKSINPIDIINYANITDLNVVFSHMMNLQLEKMILQLVNSKEHIFLLYAKNDQIFKNNRHSLKYAIKEYLDNNDESQLIKHIEYFKKSKSEFIIELCKKNLQNIFNLLSEPELQTIDYNNITKNNKSALFVSYYKFQNQNMRALDMIDDIFNLSICNELIKGRFSLQLLINNIEYINKIELIEFLINIYEWLKSNIELAEYIDYNYDIIINKFIIGKINLILDNRMIIIESKITQKPSINDYIKYLLFWSKYNLDNINNIEQNTKLTIIQYYNPITGKIFEWDMSDFILNSDNKYELIYNYFLNMSIQTKLN